jgi:hypothetical protein
MRKSALAQFALQNNRKPGVKCLFIRTFAWTTGMPKHRTSIRLSRFRGDEIVEVRNMDTSPALPKFAGERAADETAKADNHYSQSCSSLTILAAETWSRFLRPYTATVFFAIHFPKQKRSLCYFYPPAFTACCLYRKYFFDADVKLRAIYLLPARGAFVAFHRLPVGPEMIASLIVAGLSLAGWQAAEHRRVS